MGGHEERELSSVFQVLPQFALKASRYRLYERVGDEVEDSNYAE